MLEAWAEQLVSGLLLMVVEVVVMGNNHSFPTLG